MAIGDIPLFRLAERRLAWIDAREQLLARNIANADTPGYRPRDLLPFAAGLARAQARLDVTDPGHLGPVGPAGPAGAQRSVVAEQAPDGNAVSIEDQLTRIADTQTAHDLTTDLYRKYLGLFRLAIGR